MNKKDESTGAATRLRIIEAALETLKTDGFAGATSRAIARTGDFNQALVFYHFGSLDGLLLAALDHTSAERLDRYRQALDDAKTVEDLLSLAVRVQIEDREAGQTAVVAQMIAGSVARPELAPEMIARMEPWLDLCADALGEGFAYLGLRPQAPLRELAYAVVTFYLGVNLLTHLDESRRIDTLFGRIEDLAPALAPLAEQIGRAIPGLAETHSKRR